MNDVPTSCDILEYAEYTPYVGCEFTASGGYSWESTLARLKRFDFIIVYLSLIITAVLLILIVFFGDSTPFSQSIIQPNRNSWVIRGLWVLGTILSYVSFYFIYQDVREYPIPQDLKMSVLFLISNFIFIAWAAVFYYAQDIVLNMWIGVIIFIYNYGLFLYMWHLSPIAALFLIPNMILYGYLVYISAHTASLNNVPI